ncbi:MAG: carboxypeptidase-like regulatory domain-containing protein [Planctomycetota bacterium]
MARRRTRLAPLPSAVTWLLGAVVAGAAAWWTVLYVVETQAAPPLVIGDGPPDAPSRPLPALSPPAAPIDDPLSFYVVPHDVPPSPEPLSGRVVDAETDAPIQGAMVRARAWHGTWPSVTVLTDADGRYEIPTPPKSMEALTVWHPRYAGARTLRGREGAEIQLQRGRYLNGVVLAADGSPAAGARVVLAMSGWASSEGLEDRDWPATPP